MKTTVAWRWKRWKLKKGRAVQRSDRHACQQPWQIRRTECGMFSNTKAGCGARPTRGFKSKVMQHYTASGQALCTLLRFDRLAGDDCSCSPYVLVLAHELHSRLP